MADIVSRNKPIIGVIGASGFIGFNLSKYLAQNGYHVKALSRHTSEFISSFSSFKIDLIDLRSKDLFLERLNNVDYVIDCGSCDCSGLPTVCGSATSSDGVAANLWRIGSGCDRHTHRNAHWAWAGVGLRRSSGGFWCSADHGDAAIRITPVGVASDELCAGRARNRLGDIFTGYVLNACADEPV